MSVQELVRKVIDANTTVGSLIRKVFNVRDTNEHLLATLSQRCTDQVQVFPVAIVDTTYEYIRNTWHKVT